MLLLVHESRADLPAFAVRLISKDFLVFATPEGAPSEQTLSHLRQYMSFYRSTKNRYCHWYTRTYHSLDMTVTTKEIHEAMRLLLSNGYVYSMWTTKELAQLNISDIRQVGSLGEIIARTRVVLAERS